MMLTDQQVIDLVNGVLDRECVPPTDRLRRLRESTIALPGLQPVVERYLAIVEPPRLCQVEHDHWEGKMICGNVLPCRTHGGSR